MDEEEIDKIVEQIKAPIMALEGIDAEMVMLHAAFTVMDTVEWGQNGRTRADIRKILLGAYDAYSQSNPLPQRH